MTSTENEKRRKDGSTAEKKHSTKLAMHVRKVVRRRVRVTIVAVEKQKVLHILCVCV